MNIVTTSAIFVNSFLTGRSRINVDDSPGISTVVALFDATLSYSDGFNSLAGAEPASAGFAGASWLAEPASAGFTRFGIMRRCASRTDDALFSRCSWCSFPFLSAVVDIVVTAVRISSRRELTVRRFLSFSDSTFNRVRG